MMRIEMPRALRVLHMSGDSKKQHSIFELSQRKKNESLVPCPVCGRGLALKMELRIQHVETCLTMQLLREERDVKEEGNVQEEMGEVKEESREIKEEEDVKEVKLAKQTEVAEVAKLTEVAKMIETREATHSKNAVLSEVVNIEKPTEKGKLKKRLGSVQIENLRYVNSKPTVKRPRKAREEPQTELLPSSRKNEIPELKIMRFTVGPNVDYCVSVDAFCFKPTEHIHQYFLSHFHSDHYGGISKRWARERTLDSKIIYCSEITARLLQIRYNIEEEFIFLMKNNTRYKVHCYREKQEALVSEENTPGLYATPIDANHCPGAVIFLFESISLAGQKTHYLHCGDFRVCESMMQHPKLQDFLLSGNLTLDKVYLDTTYMSPKYNFPKQQQVCASVAETMEKLLQDDKFSKQCFGKSLQSRITDLFSSRPKKKLLVLIGTYLIGKERLATAILRRIQNAPIYVSNTGSRGDKEHIIRSYNDEFMDSVLTSDPTPSGQHKVVIHLVPMSIAGNIQEIAKYFNNNKYHQHFERCIGIRPTGWSFQNGEETETIDPDIDTDVKKEIDTETLAREVNILRKQPKYSYLDIAKQNTPKRYGKVDSSLYRLFSVPYSEHLSFRELSFFTIFLNIRKVIPTVNTGNEFSVQKMEHIIRRWEKIRERAKDLDLKLEDF